MTTHQTDQAAILQTFQELQRQTAEAHMMYQQSMAQSHAAFLAASEKTFLGFAQLLSGQSIEPVPQMSEQSFVQTREPLFNMEQYLPALPGAVPSAAVPLAPNLQSSEGDQRASMPNHPIPQAEMAPVQVAGFHQATDVDVSALMLSVVAEKTGYPVEMLGSEMDLEGDLGIDSIKRVEILSAVQDRLQDSFVVDAQAMSTLRTIGEIITYIDDNLKKN